MMEGK
jgi:hypothetical protein